MTPPGTTSSTLPWDWYPGSLPANVSVADGAYVETTFSFHLFRSEQDPGVVYEPGAATYLGTMFDVGRRGQVVLGPYALVHGARFICERRIEIGAYALVSWNTVFMDSYRLPVDPLARRAPLHRAARDRRVVDADPHARPIRVRDNVWIGFDVCVLPGVTIGDGAVVGAKSVVFDDVPPYTVVAGNPARVIRVLDPGSRPPGPGPNTRTTNEDDHAQP